MAEAIHGDLSVRVVVHTEPMPWSASPSGTVWRKRLHLVGPAESGQVTSVVHYQEQSQFPPHGHPDGEEILVLSGVFSDEHGDWPAGSYLLNPESFRHAPYSREGCLLFVKLRQYPGTDRSHVAVDAHTMWWSPRVWGANARSFMPSPATRIRPDSRDGRLRRRSGSRLTRAVRSCLCSRDHSKMSTDVMRRRHGCGSRSASRIVRRHERDASCTSRKAVSPTFAASSTRA
jgi:ChrR Cupin-like domain